MSTHERDHRQEERDESILQIECEMFFIQASTSSRWYEDDNKSVMELSETIKY